MTKLLFAWPALLRVVNQQKERRVKEGGRGEGGMLTKRLRGGKGKKNE